MIAAPCRGDYAWFATFGEPKPQTSERHRVAQ
jgi:hypothetical protein